MRYSNFELPKLIFKLYLINSPEVTSGVFPLKVAVPNTLKGFFLLQTCNYFGLSFLEKFGCLEFFISSRFNKGEVFSLKYMYELLLCAK